MEGSPYRKFSIFWKGARFRGPNSGFLLAGTWSIPLSRIRGSGSCLEAGGNDTGAPPRQDPIPLVLLAWVPLKPELILNPGTRVHSRRRVGNEACESMDSSESSLDLTAEIEELRNAAVGEAPLPPGGEKLSSVGPLSIIRVEEVVNWRKKCMPSSTRSSKDKHLLFSEDPAHLERTIRKDQRSTSIDVAAFTSTDSRTQPSTDTRPSSSTDLHRSTSIDTTPRTSIGHQSRNMVAIVILRQNENRNLYDQDGHLRNATGVEETFIRKNKQDYKELSKNPNFSRLVLVSQPWRGSPYRKFSISWKGARFQGPNSGFLLAGTWSVPLSGTRGSGSCLEAGGNNTRIFFPNSLPLISRFRHRSRGIICALKSTGVAHSQQAPLRQDPVPLVLLAWVPLKLELILNPGWSSEIRTTRGLQRVGEMILVMGFSRSHFPYRASRLVFPRSLTFLTRVGTRVHSRRRVGKEACESMDSSESSLDVTAEIKELRNAAVGEAPPPPGGDRFSPVGPLSIIGVEEVANWRKKFRLPDDVIIRIPGPFDRVSDFELVKISPGQLNHPSWRILIAMQSLGDLEGFTVGVAEVPYCYFVSPLNGGEFRYHLHPRGKALPVRELSKAERKRCPVFEGCWTLKFTFMPFLGFSPTWCAADISRSDYSSGRDTIEQLLELPLERREVSFLVSDEALDRCSIRGVMSKTGPGLMPNRVNITQFTIPFTKGMKIYTGGPNVQHQAIRSSLPKATCKKDNGVG
ncbi:hypothetical protein F2Q70_00025800 [Brassica cretica]|uniref:Uncharacterized protein n=1 Tax=Brassica cretica TaxID=69181 RepID=A0A8S9LHC3_BRACR|nr:hypothetical protein F2Q70_00025800 [Brassica cretica]